MAKADVKLTLTPTDFRLVIECLIECLELERDGQKDATVGDEEWQQRGQRILHLERLLRELE